jgi:ABC-type transport system involved in multi-copper enzyme maturation permease subunit
MDGLGSAAGLLIAQAGPVDLIRPMMVLQDALKHVAWSGGVALLAVALLLAFLYGTRTGIIARATAKEAIRQPVFPLLLVVALVLLVVNTYVPFFSLGDDVKMLEICGLAMLSICGMLLAIWTSSMSIADEIEGKTAMTLLSKPINRRQFIIGKFFGIQSAVLLFSLPIILAFGGLIFYKVFYDAKESTRDDVTWHLALAEALRVIPAVLLRLQEIMVMSAISVAISTRLPMVVNMTTCLAIYIVGHLTEPLVLSNLERLELVAFMARVIAAVMPAVQVYNVEAKLMGDGLIPESYLGLTALYSIGYMVAAILAAFIMFEDRDLA